jgi:ABC-2 type transport system ATP-binding protein
MVDELTTLLDVSAKLDTMVRELSLGERMKMELISALLHAPRVLFLDEPTIGLDVTSQQKVREFLREYNAERGIVTMLTSHYMEDIEALCRRVIIIDHGKTFFDGPLAEIVDRFATHKVVALTFGETPQCDLTSAGEILERDGRRVKLRIARNRVTDTLRELLGSCRVQDLSVEDPPIDEVIRQVFAAETNAKAEAAATASAAVTTESSNG